MGTYHVALTFALICFTACGDDCAEPHWNAVFADETKLDRSVLSVWGNETDVFLVGGGLGVEGAGALVLRYDGSSWEELPTGRDETLWWVWGTSSTDVWAVGEKGLVLHWDGAAFTVVDHPAGEVTLYGVWGSSADDVYVVGGMPGPEASPDDVVLRWDGATLSPDAAIARGAALFKVWGSSRDDVWVSGEGGTLLHLSGGVWSDRSDELATFSSLFTVHGCAANDVYVVGGDDVFHYDGATWSPVDVQVFAGANGVSCAPDGVLLVGFAGLKLRRDARGEWIDDTFEDPYDTDFHGAWVSPSGELWAVGGNFLNPPSFGAREGVVGFRGCPAPPSRIGGQ